MQYSQEHLKTMVYAEFGGQTECIMGNSKKKRMEFGNIYNADICGISIVMEIFLLISWKMLAIDRVCVFVLCFSHNNHFFYWSRVFHRAWLWSSSGEIVDLRCGTIILFPFSRDWLISFILEREFEIALKLQPTNKRLCDLTWKKPRNRTFSAP